MQKLRGLRKKLDVVVINLTIDIRVVMELYESVRRDGDTKESYTG